MLNSRMLYKHPGKHEIDGDFYDYIIVHEDDTDACIKDGWSLSAIEAKESKKKTVKAKESKGKDKPKDD